MMKNRIKVSFHPDNKFRISDLYDSLPVLILALCVCLSYIITGKTVITFAFLMAAGGVGTTYIFTKYYSNAKIGSCKEGLSLIYGKNNKVFKWEDIQDIKFYKIWNGLRKVIVIEIKYKNSIYRIVIFSYFFSIPIKSYRKLATQIKYYFVECDFNLYKAENGVFPPPWIIDL